MAASRSHHTRSETAADARLAAGRSIILVLLRLQVRPRLQENGMRNFLTWVMVFVAGLLIGFVPQFWKSRGVREELTSCQTRADLAKVQQSAALTYVAATQLNYGLASGYAQTFFANAQSVQAKTPDPAIKDVLTQVLTARDKVTADLAKGSPEVVAELQPLVLKLEQAGQ
jgi:hypothetical protein